MNGATVTLRLPTGLYWLWVEEEFFRRKGDHYGPTT